MCSMCDEPTATTNAGGAVSVTSALLPCGTPCAGACRDGILVVVAKGFASTSQLGKRGELARKDDAKLLEFWAVVVDPG